MPHRLFHQLCLNVAEQETRTVIVPHDLENLPADAYHLLEYYCVDPRCRCNLMKFHIVSDKHPNPDQPLARFNFGWRVPAYYLEWSYGDPESLSLAGLSFDFPQAQGSLAEVLFELVQSQLTPEFIQRLILHDRIAQKIVHAKPLRRKGIKRP